LIAIFAVGFRKLYFRHFGLIFHTVSQDLASIVCTVFSVLSPARSNEACASNPAQSNKPYKYLYKKQPL